MTVESILKLGLGLGLYLKPEVQKIDKYGLFFKRFVVLKKTVFGVPTSEERET